MQHSDWDRRDVLIGLLRGQQQLECNLAHRFYHMPVRLLSAAPEDVAVVALYQSRKRFGEEAGIRYYGRVQAVQRLRRGDIRELPTKTPEEPFIRFAVAEWETLEHPIRAGGLSPGIGTMTTQHLLQGSQYVPELLILTEADYRLYTQLKQASLRTKQGGSERLPSRDGVEVLVSGWTIGVYLSSGRYEQWDLRAFYQEPYSFLCQMRQYILLADGLESAAVL